MKSLMLAAVAAATLVCGTASAQQVERYQALALALEVDEACGFLPWIEHLALREVASEAVRLSPLSSMAAKMGNDAVGAFWRKTEADAQALGCNQASAQKVAPFRGELLQELAVAGVTAELRDQIHKQPASLTSFGLGPVGVALTEQGRMDGARLAAYLRGAFGANADGVFRRAAEIARQRVDADPENKNSSWSSYFYYVDYQARAETDRRLMVSGPTFAVQRLKGQDGGVQHSSFRTFFGKGGTGKVVLLERGGALYALMYETLDSKLPGVTGLRAYLRKPDAPAKKNGLPLSWDGTWRDSSVKYDLVKTTETAFGAPLWRVPPEAVAALKAQTKDDRIEIAVVRGADDGAASGGSLRTTFEIEAWKPLLKP